LHNGELYDLYSATCYLDDEIKDEMG